MDRCRVVVFYGNCRSLQQLSKRVLINVLVFVVLRYCTFSFLWKNLCLQVTADESNISKSIQGNIAFNFDVISGAANILV